MVLELKAIDFKDSTFLSTCNCAVANAARRETSRKHILEGVYEIQIGKATYTHKYYGDTDFYRDFQIAQKEEYSPDHIIRTLTLTKKS